MSVGQPAACRAAGVLAVVLFAWWATADGGYAPGAWYPGALLVLAALAGCVRPGSYRAPAPPARWALAALAGFMVWSFCSIAWADARGDAWDGANRTMLYLTVFALFAGVAWTAGEAAAGLGAFALATASVGAWEIVRALAGDAPAVFFDGRLAAPIGYENASAALFLAAFWAALLIAARRQTPWIARGILLAAAGLLLELTILAQSRGSLVAGAVTLAVAVALVRPRTPLLLALSAVALTAGASLPALLSIYDGGAPGGEPDLAPVAVAMSLSAVLLFAAGLSLEAAARWVGVHARLSRTRVLAAAAVLVTAMAGGLMLAGGPTAAARSVADSRFAAGPGSGRYDFWRVATMEFARHPVGGVGADNFAHDYVRDRDGREEPLYPHSLALRAVAQAGAVGGALLALFLGAVAIAVSRLPAGDDARRSVAVAALVTGAVWVSHGSIDWLWEIPAVGAPAMAAMGVAAWMGPRDAAGPTRVPPGTRIALAAAACAAALSYALPALSAREVDGAVRSWSADPAAALRRLEHARKLNPLSDRPDLVAGLLARRAGDHDRARRAFLKALEHDARSWNVHVEVVLLDLRDGRRTAALHRLERARALNPGEPVIGAALETAARGEAPATDLLDRLYERGVPGPTARRPLDCLPVQGLGAACTREARG
jgi:tetratricopeptide (TPR) repeat protein